MLVLAIVAITLALVFYTIGVWWERKEGRLRGVHLAFFIMGLVSDTVGTAAMSIIARSKAETGTMISIHGITGIVAIVLMLIHAIWAVATLVRGRENELKAFHKFSIVVWVIWLIPYILGMVMGMM